MKEKRACDSTSKKRETTGSGRCAKCRWRGKTNGRVICDYLEQTGRARHLICPPGNDCTVFEPGAPLKKVKGEMKVAEAMEVKSDRELVEELVCEGKRNSEISALTGLPAKTVANYRYRMKKPSEKIEETIENPKPPEEDREGRQWISRLCTILDIAEQETDVAVLKTIEVFAKDYATAQIEKEVRT